MSYSVSTSSWNEIVDLTALVGFAALAAIWQRMRWEVNRVLPSDRRFGFWEWPWRSLKIYPMHKELFPASRLRMAHNILMAIWIPFGIMGYFRLHQAIDAWRPR